MLFNKSAYKNAETTSLVVVGSGIKFLSHLTTEAKAYIEQSDKVLYLVNEPVMKEWIQKNNKNTESLDEIYFKYPLRLQCYRAITEYILETLRKDLHLCVVIYGHPSVFAQPALEAVIQAKEERYYAKILPGISAEDCLFADLLFDPGRYGCQSFEATDFLIHQRKFDISSHLILWQVGVIGALGHPINHDNKNGAMQLMKYLLKFYDAKHKISLYEAAQYPGFEPKINELELAQLAEAEISRIATMHIPPIKKTEMNMEMLQALNIDINALK